MRVFWGIVFGLVALAVAAQQSEWRSLPPQADLAPLQMAHHLTQRQPQLEWKVADTRQSQHARHYMLKCSYLGLPVLNGYIKINYTPATGETSFYWQLPEAIPPQPQGGSAWYIHQTVLVACTADTTAEAIAIADLEGRVLETIPVKARSGLPDTVNAYVFLPDPLSSSGQPYGCPYCDNDDATNPQLDAERFLVSLPVQLDTLDNLWKPFSPNIKLVDYAPPTGGLPFFAAKQDLLFDRSQPEFEYINAFYHTWVLFDRAALLGFTEHRQHVLQIEARAGMADASAYSWLNGHKLELGTGGIDDGEDADVTIHELAHFFSQLASPGTRQGVERMALEEGFADFCACSYSKAITETFSERVFNWDGNTASWTGRQCYTDKLYPSDIVQDIYEDGELICGLLMDYFDAAGADAADRLLLQSLYFLAPGMSMQQYVNELQHIARTDSIAYKREVLEQLSTERGFQLLGMKGQKEAKTPQLRVIEGRIRIDGQQGPGLVSVYGAGGKRLLETTATPGREVPLPHLPKGVYMIRFSPFNSESNGAHWKHLQW